MLQIKRLDDLLIEALVVVSDGVLIERPNALKVLEMLKADQIPKWIAQRIGNRRLLPNQTLTQESREDSLCDFLDT
jgi:hypothetical protein